MEVHERQDTIFHLSFYFIFPLLCPDCPDCNPILYPLNSTFISVYPIISVLFPCLYFSTSHASTQERPLHVFSTQTPSHTLIFHFLIIFHHSPPLQYFFLLTLLLNSVMAHSCIYPLSSNQTHLPHLNTLTTHPCIAPYTFHYRTPHSLLLAVITPLPRTVAL